MAWPQQAFTNAVVDFGEGPDAQFRLPPEGPDHNLDPLDWKLPSGEVIHFHRRGPHPRHEVRPPINLWKNGGREKAAFGTQMVEMSLGQARLRKLVVRSALFKGDVRTQSRHSRGEDALLTAYDRKQPAKAKAKAAATSTQETETP